MPEDIPRVVENVVADHVAQSGKKTWLDMRHPEHALNAYKWRFARDHYEASVLERSRIVEYLIRKATAESEAAYLERAELADYTPHFSAVVDSLAGMLFAVEEDSNRFLGDDETPGLGDPDDEESAMFRLWRNIDGNGTGWLTSFKQLAIELIISHRSWMIVDQDEEGQAVVRIWPATSVPNWLHDSRGMKEVLITERVDRRTSVKDDTKKIVDTWVLYTRDGWERYEKAENGEPKKIDGAAYGRPFVDEKNQPILPIFPVKLPISRQVGWTLAKKANAIFNKESERDHLLRSANFPLLLLVGNDSQFRAQLEDIKRGARALRQDPTYSTSHQFIAPSADSATVASEVLKRKVEEFYVTAFREYGDAARERTATEVRQDVSSGIGAFLQMLKAAVDDAENEVMKRVAQIEYPADERRWFINTVERADTFVPTDVQLLAQRLKERYFPKDVPVPLGPSGLLNLVKQLASYDGVDIDENELKASIQTGEVQRLAALFAELPVPATVRVAMTIDLLVALGKVDPEEMEKLEDGSERFILDGLKEEMLSLAMADDEAKKRMAQPLDMGPPGVGGRLPDDDDEDDEE